MVGLVKDTSADASVLLLADKDDEIELVKSAAGTHKLQVARTCPDVLQYLRDVAQRPERFRPGLILLNLDIANTEHCETLREIKEDVRLRRIPVIVLAEDESDTAVNDAYNMRANACVVKPKEPLAFVQMVETTLSFWLDVTRLA